MKKEWFVIINRAYATVTFQDKKKEECSLSGPLVQIFHKNSQNKV